MVPYRDISGAAREPSAAAHFPTRLDLIEAVLAEQVAELAGFGRGPLPAEDEFDALSTWLRAVLRHALTYRGLSAAVMNSALGGTSGIRAGGFPIAMVSSEAEPKTNTRRGCPPTAPADRMSPHLHLNVGQLDVWSGGGR